MPLGQARNELSYVSPLTAKGQMMSPRRRIHVHAPPAALRVDADLNVFNGRRRTASVNRPEDAIRYPANHTGQRTRPVSRFGVLRPGMIAVIGPVSS